MWVSVAARAARRDLDGKTPRMARVKVLEDFPGKAAYMGAGVGKLSHWAYALDASGRKLLSRAVANDEADIREALFGMPEGTLAVVDQRKNIGALVFRVFCQ